MITKEEATKRIEQALPEYTIKLGPVVYKNLFLFSLYNDGLGGELDPFYSVNRSTGFVSGFSILENIEEIPQKCFFRRSQPATDISRLHLFFEQSQLRNER